MAPVKMSYNALEDSMEFAIMSVAELLEQAKTLSHREQQELLDLLADHLAIQPRRPTRSLSDLRGLGTGYWQGVDIEDYVNELRDEWD